ncbi:MAG: hypothetical protein JWM44_466 [Bacilli bacterium]|nr:hypothetical protein [Bacilli bacterium]
MTKTINHGMKILIVGALIFTLTGCAYTEKAPLGSKIESNIIEKNMRTVQVASFDLGQKGVLNKVKLTVEMDKYENPALWTIAVDGKDVIHIPSFNGTYMSSKADLKLESFAPNKPLILLYRYSSGSGGKTAVDIYDPQDHWRQILFSDELANSLEGRFNVQYTAENKAELIDVVSNVKVELPLTGDNINTTTPLRPPIGADPISEYTIEDVDGDGIKELIALQRVAGYVHAGTLGYVKTILKYESNTFKPVSLEILDAENKRLKTEAFQGQTLSR